MGRKLVILFISFGAFLILFGIIRELFEVPIDCMPTIGERPFLERLISLLFRTRCVTF